MIDSGLLTAGRYGYRQRRIHRGDFAWVLTRLLPPEGANRFPPVATLPPEDLATAAKLCSHLAGRYRGERLGTVAGVVARQLLHPATPAGHGQLLLYPAALLCRELQALSAVEAATSVAAVLEERSARRTAAVLKTAISAEVRYPTQVIFDGNFMRAANYAKSA